MFRHSLTRRDAFLILLGAFSMHLWTLFFRENPSDNAILVDARVDNPADHPQAALTARTILTKTVTETAIPIPTRDAALEKAARERDNRELPHTSTIAHAPGWTLFKNLYMSNGTLYILTSSPDTFPEFRLMTSTGLPAENTAENMALREPTKENMDFITPDDALERWGGDPNRGETNRVWTVEGNTLLFNDPPQFLRHYYHLVAELFFGVQAFWHGAFSPPETTTSEVTAQQLAFSSHHPVPPHIDRAIFAHSNAEGWRDVPGFNSYFIRAAYPSITVEHQQDWNDRIIATKDDTRVWRFPVVLLTDRSASHRGRVCGALTQRTASEAWEAMRRLGKLRGRHIGGWWEPVRNAVWEFAGMSARERRPDEIQLPMRDIVIPGAGAWEGKDEILDGMGVEAQKFLPMPDTIVITYISRQNTSRRKLVPEDHVVLVKELEALVKRKNEEEDQGGMEKKRKWELHVLQAEKMTKDEQVRAAAKTTFMLGVHGNGLTSLVWMKPSRISTVIELFYPGGFAHDYQWTTRSLGMVHYAVWNDTYRTHPNKPDVAYPEGFQGNQIPVYGPLVAKLIEDRVEGVL